MPRAAVRCGAGKFAWSASSNDAIGAVLRALGSGTHITRARRLLYCTNPVTKPPGAGYGTVIYAKYSIPEQHGFYNDTKLQVAATANQLGPILVSHTVAYLEYVSRSTFA